MRILAPGFEPAELESLEELEVGVAWLHEAEPLVRDRVAEAAAFFPCRRELELPLAPDNRADFMREVADVHRPLFVGNEELYGDNVRGKIERALRVSDADAAEAERGRPEYRDRVTEAVGELDLLVTPTLTLVAPPADTDELELRGRGTAFTFPFSSLGWPALALPCGAAEDGLPASVQLTAPRGSDARVLAAGRLLAAGLAGRARPELPL
jgi:Asp-tRNA(Asn)/Glu-tRNA(Gln) amidotransferase A subunit family amidase